VPGRAGRRLADSIRPRMTEPPAAPPIDVSVIVIGADVRDEVLACLESVHRHAGRQRVESIYVDNGSGDGSVAAVREQGRARHVVALPRNEGGSARNHGMDVARGRTRMFLDSDALLTEGALDELVGFLDAHPGVGLVGPRLVYPDGGPQPSARRVPGPYLPFLRRPPLARFAEEGSIVRHHLMEREMREAPDRAREVEYVIGACQLFTARAERAAGRLDARIPFAPEDIDWCLHIRAGGLRIAYDPAATVVHGYRRTSAQAPFSRTSAEHLYGFVVFLLKWRSRWRAIRADGRRIDGADGALEAVRAS
jgi:N-acetylglucosaminyl-diphospho-decaprenol L-rhamnosyltransferase